MDRMAQMETFIRVVETGSFSSAARLLHVGQPAVSKTVAQLESHLGVKLLTRSTRGLTPTEAGLGYFERAKRAVEEADEAELAARGAGTGLKGRLRICAAVTFARIHLIPLLPQFLAQNPDLDLEVVLDDRQIDLVQEGIDLGLRMGKLLDFAAHRASHRPLQKARPRNSGILQTQGHTGRAGRSQRSPGRCLSPGRGKHLVVFARRFGSFGEGLEFG